MIMVLPKSPNHLSSFLVILYVLVAAGFPLGSSVQRVEIPENVSVPAILMFGDSIVDTGNNNNNVNILARSNYPPYGKDFQGGKPTGRFSNGKVPSDFIAEAFGIKELLPAYRDQSLQIEDLLTGVNFATGATGYDTFTDQLASVNSTSDQVQFFKEYIEKIKSAVGEERTKFILSNSIVIICLGTNDINNAYPFRSVQYDINSYTDLLIKLGTDFYQELYRLGARRIGVLGVPVIGCVPSQRTLRGGIERNCSENENQQARLFNSKLSSKLNSLSKQFPDARFVYIDIYNPLLLLIQNPSRYGFEVANRGCCGTGVIEVTALCNRFTPTCPDATKYVFWDSFHPTERAYDILVDIIINNIKNQLF